MGHIGDPEPSREPEPDLVSQLFDGFTSEEVDGVDLPHVVVCRNRATGMLTCEGPYPSGLAALTAAQHDSDTEREHDDVLEFTACPLSPVPAPRGEPSGRAWRVRVLLVDAAYQFDQLLCAGVVPDLDAARIFAEQAALAASPLRNGALVVAIADAGRIGRQDDQHVFEHTGPGADRVATVGPTGRLGIWATELGSVAES